MERNGGQRGSDRKRGRPVGRGRVPLSAEERRARNAQYERERRVGTAEAMSSLAAALGCPPNASNAEIIAKAIQKLRNMQENVDPSDDMAVIKRRNAALMAQINDVEDRLKSGNSGEAQPKIKTKKPKTVLRPAIGSAQIDFAIIGNRSSDEEEDEDEDEEVPMTEAAEDQMDSVSFDAITDCPMDWGIDNCLADYML